MNTNQRLENIMKNLRLDAVSTVLGMLSPLLALANSSASGASDASPFQFGWQSTYIYQYKDSFTAPYTPGLNSLSPDSERSYSLTATALAGVRLGPDTILYFNPEVYRAHVFSDLTGLAGPADAEQQKGGGANGFTLYTARAFLRQTWNLGGSDESVARDLTHLSETVKSRRIVLSAGKMSVVDIFDTSPILGNPRTNFLNWSFVTYGAYDYAADLRGYTSGLALEYYKDDWAVRYGRFQMPAVPNTSSMNNGFLKDFGEQVEIEHDYKLGDLAGFVKILVYRNVANMGGYSVSVALANQQSSQPDLAATRARHTKYGTGIHVEQAITPNVAFFTRLSANDGKYEEAAFAEIDKQVEFGFAGTGIPWDRDDDSYGAGYVVNGLSNPHRSYLAAGGLGGFLGDGSLSYHTEDIFESFYDFALPSRLHLAFDYQNIADPGYNAARRGPVNFFGIRLHYENF